jgi:hypothetical protein
MSVVPIILPSLPLVLSLSKDACRLEAHFDKLSANECSLPEPKQ